MNNIKNELNDIETLRDFVDLLLGEVTPENDMDEIHLMKIDKILLEKKELLQDELAIREY